LIAGEPSWVAILGAVSGISSLIIWLLNKVTKPKLAFSTGPYVRTWKITINNTTNTWNFVNFEVVSKKGLAIGCEAKAIVIKHPDNVTIFKEYLKEGHGLHWADVAYSGRSTGVDRVDIGSASQRLDVVFTVPTQRRQSYLAMPIALTSLWNKSQIPPQAILTQGEYMLKIKVSCANGRGDTKTIRVFSPDDWQDLRAEEIKRVRFPICRK
jgi:hypothetical protein